MTRFYLEIQSKAHELGAHESGGYMYLDGILIFSKNIEEHKTHLKTVFELLEKNKLFLNKNKCEFLLDKITFLGYKISEKGIEPDDMKIKWVNYILANDPYGQKRNFTNCQRKCTGKAMGKARESLIAHLDTPDIARSFNQKLLNARLEIGESIPHFSDRFYLYVERSKIDPNSTFICGKYMACLPEHLQNQLTKLCLSKPKLTDLIKKCMEIDSFNNSLLQLSTLNPQQSKHTSFTKICTYCNNLGDMEFECLKRKSEFMERQKNMPSITNQTRNLSSNKDINEFKRNNPISANSLKQRSANAPNSTFNHKPFFGPKSAAYTSVNISEHSLRNAYKGYGQH